MGDHVPTHIFGGCELFQALWAFVVFGACQIRFVAVMCVDMFNKVFTGREFKTANGADQIRSLGPGGEPCGRGRWSGTGNICRISHMTIAAGLSRASAHGFSGGPRD